MWKDINWLRIWDISFESVFIWSDTKGYKATMHLGLFSGAEAKGQRRESIIILDTKAGGTSFEISSWTALTFRPYLEIVW